jgi:hypothetical protein
VPLSLGLTPKTLRHDTPAFRPGRFPDSEIRGSKLVCSSPRLIAAYHVLHRLLAPRHPPYTLGSLTIFFHRTGPINRPVRVRRLLFSFIVCHLRATVSQAPRRASDRYLCGHEQVIKELKSVFAGRLAASHLGPCRDRTGDLLLAKQALSQLS